MWKRFPLVEGVVVSLGILYPAAIQDLIKFHSSIVNVALNFPHHEPVHQVEAIRQFKDVSLSYKPIPDFLYYLSKVKDRLDDSDFGMFFDPMARFMIFPRSSGSVVRIFSLVDHVKKKQTRWNGHCEGKVVGKTSIVKKAAKRLYMESAGHLNLN